MSEITLVGSNRLVKASRDKWEEIRHDEERNILFLRHLDLSSEVRRVMVYYTRDTLCVVIRESNKGNRFYYNNNCDLILLARLLDNATKFKDFGFKQNNDIASEVSGVSSSSSCKSSNYCCSPGSERSLSFLTDDEDGNSDALKEHLKRIDCQLKNLKEYRARIKARLSEKNKTKKKEDEKDEGTIPMMRSFVTEDVLAELHAITVSELACLTLTPDGKGVVYAEKSGHSYWTCAISWNLGEELRDSNQEHYPLAINLGSGERYFVRFTDDKQIVKGNDELTELVNMDKVKMVAFGPTFQSYVVLYEDGGVAWSFIPRALRRALASRSPDEPKVEYVALGPGDAYFVRFGDDTVQYGNVTDEMKDALDNCPGIVKEVTYGAGNCLIARYEPS